MWDELKAPIVPMMIIGAYDLYPVGSWVNRSGHVSVRYLPPIYAHEAKDRDEMLVLVRGYSFGLLQLTDRFLLVASSHA